MKNTPLNPLFLEGKLNEIFNFFVPSPWGRLGWGFKKNTSLFPLFLVGKFGWSSLNRNMSFKSLFLLMSMLFLLNSCDSEKIDFESKVDISEVMSVNDSSFKKAIEPIDFSFPQDHFAHNDYKIEWWYFTGNLTSKEGSKFGYQFTIFRNGISTDTNKISSFDSKNFYLAHFAISDISNNNFYFSEKTSREAVEIAGSSMEKSVIFIENWQIKIISDNNKQFPTFEISSEDSTKSINFQLIPNKNIVLHGDKGLSQKSNQAGNASYYYSFTNLNTKGNIRIKNKNYEVSGKSWFDREWSTSALNENQSGWDWFSLQLNDSTEIMCFRLRDKNNNTDFAKGTFVDKNGNVSNFKANDFSIKPIEFYKSDSGKKYPSKWLFEYKYKEKNISLEIKTQIPEQELRLFTDYYEGSVSFTGKNGQNSVSGYGYVELTGYK